MPRSCCQLHSFLDGDSFPKTLKYDEFETFAMFIQSRNNRNKAYIKENPNNMEAYIYLFSGTGTRYLSTVAGQYITFSP